MFIKKITNAQKTFNYGEKKCYLGEGDFFSLGLSPTVWWEFSLHFLGGRISVFLKGLGDVPPAYKLT